MAARRVLARAARVGRVGDDGFFSHGLNTDEARISVFAIRRFRRIFKNMLLHRYFGSHAFETLNEVTLKVSRISTFNDPFEFLYVPVGKMTPQKARTMVEYKINNPDASPHFWFVARQRFSNAKNEKELKRLVRKSIPQLVINLVSGFEKIKNTTLDNRGNVADANLRAICFCDADKTEYALEYKPI